jgi:hypothetical protein
MGAMDSGLALAAQGGQQDLTGGGLSAARSVVENPVQEDLYRDAAYRLRQMGAGGRSDVGWNFAVRAGVAPPTEDDLIQRHRQQAMAEIGAALGAQREAAGRADAILAKPPMHPMLPFARTMGRALGPTRTGSFGETLGAGMTGLAEGLAEQDRALQEFAMRRATLGSENARANLMGTEGMHRIGMSADQIGATLALAQRRLQENYFSTPGLREGLVKIAADRGVPVSAVIGMLESGQLSPAEKKAIETAVAMARGTSQMKNATAMLDPRDPNYANMVRLLQNQPLVRELMKIAEQRHPMENYEGQPEGVRNEAVNRELQYLIRAHSIGSSVGQPLDAGSADGSVPQVSPPAPAAPAIGDRPAPVAAAASAPTAFDKYFRPPPIPSNQPGQIKDKTREAGERAAIQEAEKTAAAYMKDEVRPGVTAADEMRTSAIIARSLMEKNPSLTGALKPWMASVANVMTTLGVAPKIAEQFATDQTLFQSQAMLQVLAKQLVQKGVQTESDATRILQAGIDPSKPSEANRFLIRYMEAAADRMLERSAFFRAWAEKNKGQMAGAPEAWAQYANDHPLTKVEGGKLMFRSPRSLGLIQ